MLAFFGRTAHALHVFFDVVDVDVNFDVWIGDGVCRVDGVTAVLSQVSIQVGLLTEAAIAHRTPEGLLLLVDVADVTLQVGRDTEGAFAVLALVRLFARVRAQVARQVGRAREDLATKLTSILVLRESRTPERVVGGGESRERS